MERLLRSQHNKLFLNLNEFARNIAECDECTIDNTLSVTLEAIANLEKHPPPSELGDIDLKVLYQTLANMSAGYPVNELENGPTKQFLKQCYAVSNYICISFIYIRYSMFIHSFNHLQELFDDASDTDAKSVKNAFSEQNKQTHPVYSWLCNTDYSQYLLKLFK